MNSGSLLELLGQRYVNSCSEALNGLVRDVPSISAAVVATADGFEVASVQTRGSVAAARLSALASSLLALGHAALRELSMNGGGSVLVENAMGKILLMEVHRNRLPIVLCVVADADATTGTVLWAARQCTGTLENTPP
jgi:predicted regulator of Ras-like GTPase activity (Roadblock/LC7/MglB family)